MSCVIHIGDTGTTIALRLLENGVPVDLSAATDLEMVFRKPGGECIAEDATLATDGTDGVMKITSLAGFLDEAGTWRVQGHITTASGEWRSSAATFAVACNLCTPDPPPD